MTTHLASRTQIMKARKSWILFIVIGMIVLAYGNYVAMAAGILAGLYLFHLICDVEGQIVYTDEKIIFSRMDTAETIIGTWDEVLVERVSQDKFRLSKPADKDCDPVFVKVEMFQQADKLRSVLARKVVEHHNERIGRGDNDSVE